MVLALGLRERMAVFIFMKVKQGLYRLKKTRLKAFTLLECLVSLLVISGSVLIYNGLTKSLSSNIHYLSDNRQNNWLLFSQQLRTEFANCQLDRVENNKLYVSKSGQKLVFGLSRADDFRKSNASGQGYQPMLFGLKESDISQKDKLITIKLTFDNGLERSFIYAFESKN